MQTDEALWSAVRALQEQEFLLGRLIDEGEHRGPSAAETGSSVELAQIHERAEVLRRWVSASEGDVSDTVGSRSEAEAVTKASNHHAHAGLDPSLDFSRSETNE